MFIVNDVVNNSMNTAACLQCEHMEHTVEPLHNIIIFLKNTHKRHSLSLCQWVPSLIPIWNLFLLHVIFPYDRPCYQEVPL